MFKTLKGILSIPLELLFNCSFSTGLVPDQFKVARVVPPSMNKPNTRDANVSK